MHAQAGQVLSVRARRLKMRVSCGEEITVRLLQQLQVWQRAHLKARYEAPGRSLATSRVKSKANHLLRADGAFAVGATLEAGKGVPPGS